MRKSSGLRSGLPEGFPRANPQPCLHCSLKCEQGVQTKAAHYQNVLEEEVKPLNFVEGKEWIFQQDSAPAYKAQTSQRWLAATVPYFIAAEDWLAGSLNLYPMDIRI